MPYKWKPGYVIGDYKILEQTMKLSGDQLRKAYLIICLECGWPKIIQEVQMKDGKGLSHSSCGKGFKCIYHRLYKMWSSMKSRCDNSNNSSYWNYGGRGIRHHYDYSWDFITRWRDEYLQACDLFGEENVSIERIDVDGDYSDDNIRFIHILQQAENKRNTVYFRYWKPTGETGISYNVSSFARKHGLNPSAISACLDINRNNYTHYGWEFQRISREEYKHETILRQELIKSFIINMTKELSARSTEKLIQLALDNDVNLTVEIDLIEVLTTIAVHRKYGSI